MKLSRENENFMKNIFGPTVFVIERTPVAKDLYVYSSNHVHSESFYQLGSYLVTRWFNSFIKMTQKVDFL